MRKKHSPQKADKAFSNYVYETLWSEFCDKYTKTLRSHHYRWKDGKSSYAQLCVISSRGVFIFDCENLIGTIEGTDSVEDNWINNDEVIDNPFGSIQKHISCMRENIEVQNVPIFPVVVVSDRCDINNVRCTPDNVVVCFRNMIDTLKKLSSSVKRLNKDEIDKIYGSIWTLNRQKAKEIVEVIPEEGKDKNEYVEDEPFYVQFKDGYSKKGLVKGERYKVIKQDENYYWIKGFDGKFMKSRFKRLN